MIDLTFELEEEDGSFAVFIISRDSGTRKIRDRELMGIYKSKRDAGIAVDNWLRCGD